MYYDDVKKLFNTRAKGRDYKTYNRGYNRIVFNPENEHFLVMDVAPRWVYNDSTKKYESHPGDPRLFADISPANVWTFYWSIPDNAIAEKNLIAKLTGRTVYVCSRKGNGLEDNMRFRCRTSNTPYFPGIKYDRVNNRVLNPKQDVKIRVDREASKPIYAHADKVIDMIKVLYRLGVFDQGDKVMNWAEQRAKYRSLKEMTNDQHALALCDDTLATQAEAAYWSALRTVPAYREKYYRYQTDSYETQSKEEWLDTLCATARRHYIAAMQKGHDAFIKEVVTS